MKKFPYKTTPIHQGLNYRFVLTLCIMKKILAILVISFLFSTSAHANCISILGINYCTPPGGGIIKSLGQPYCGIGQCVKSMGAVYCSTIPNGGAVKSLGSVTCQGGCMQGTSQLCQRM
mgnify:CR=1 FL=1